MACITSENASPIGTIIALILTIPFIWAIWKMDSYSLSHIVWIFLLFCFGLVFLHQLIVEIFYWVFNVIPWTYGVYTNNEFGFSTSIPLEFTNMPELHPPEPGLIIHARDKSKYAAITIYAGSNYYGYHPLITDIERLEKQTMEQVHGRLESMERISIDQTNAVKTISEQPPVRTKKIVLIKGGVEYIIICSAPTEHFSVFDPAFEKCFSTLIWNPVKK
jgi:hypothetical protein